MMVELEVHSAADFEKDVNVIDSVEFGGGSEEVEFGIIEVDEPCTTEDLEGLVDVVEDAAGGLGIEDQIIVGGPAAADAGFTFHEGDTGTDAGVGVEGRADRLLKFPVQGDGNDLEVIAGVAVAGPGKVRVYRSGRGNC